MNQWNINTIPNSICGDALWVEVNAGLFFYDFKTEMPRPSFPGDFFLNLTKLCYHSTVKKQNNISTSPSFFIHK